MYKYFERRSPDQPRLYRTTDPQHQCECFDCGHWKDGYDLVTSPEEFREITAATAQSLYPAAFPLPPTPPLDLTKPVQTRDGRPVRILCTDRKHAFPVVGLAQEQVFSWLADGRSENNWDLDLVNVPPPPPKKHTVKIWLNIYPGCPPISYLSKAEADVCASLNRVACVQVTLGFIEGEGL